jgi:hypothetical protein
MARTATAPSGRESDQVKVLMTAGESFASVDQTIERAPLSPAAAHRGR